MLVMSAAFGGPGGAGRIDRIEQEAGKNHKQRGLDRLDIQWNSIGEESVEMTEETAQPWPVTF